MFLNHKRTQQIRVTRSHSELLANYSVDVHARVPRQAIEPAPWVTYRRARTHLAGTAHLCFKHLTIEYTF